MAVARGSFEVTVTPLELAKELDGAPLGSWLIEKSYSGDLAAAAKGQMLGAGDPAAGRAGYVAVEGVAGTLLGRTGSFVLQHSGKMDGGETELTIVVVPGTGTGELEGLTGRMTIEVVDGRHHYRFEHELPRGAR